MFDGENHCIIGQNIKFSPYTTHECKIVGFEVDPRTICQYTGLKDMTGRRIYENHIVKIAGEDGYFLMVWNDYTARFAMDGYGLTVDFENYWAHEIEIVSDIFDNAELLGRENEE